MMPESIQCPGCAKSYRLKPELQGRKVKCVQCGQQFAIAPAKVVVEPVLEIIEDEPAQPSTDPLGGFLDEELAGGPAVASPALSQPDSPFAGGGPLQSTKKKRKRPKQQISISLDGGLKRFLAKRKLLVAFAVGVLLMTFLYGGVGLPGLTIAFVALVGLGIAPFGLLPYPAPGQSKSGAIVAVIGVICIIGNLLVTFYSGMLRVPPGAPTAVVAGLYVGIAIGLAILLGILAAVCLACRQFGFFRVAACLYGIYFGGLFLLIQAVIGSVPTSGNSASQVASPSPSQAIESRSVAANKARSTPSVSDQQYDSQSKQNLADFRQVAALLRTVNNEASAQAVAADVREVLARLDQGLRNHAAWNRRLTPQQQRGVGQRYVEQLKSAGNQAGFQIGRVSQIAAAGTMLGNDLRRFTDTLLALARGEIAPSNAGGSRPDPIARLLVDLELSESRRRRAASELSRMAPDEEHRQAVARALLPLLSDQKSSVRRAALEALAVWHTPETIPAMIEALRDDDRSVRQAALGALAATKDERVIEALVRLLVEQEGGVIVAKALESLGPVVEPALLEHLDPSNTRLFQAVCSILEKVGTQESIPELKRLARHESLIVRSIAKRAGRAILAANRSADQPAQTTSTTGSRAAASTDPDADDRDPSFRVDDSHALDEMEAAIRRRREGMTDQEREAVEQMLQLLEAEGHEQTNRMAWRLRQALADTDEAARPADTDTAQQPETAGGGSLEDVLAGLKSTDRRTEILAAEQLTQMKPDQEQRKEVAKALVRLLADRKAQVRVAALRALGTWHTPESIARVVECLQDDSSEVCAAAMQALSDSKDPRAAEALAGQLALNARVVGNHLLNMGPVAEDALLECLDDARPAVLVTACKILGQIGTEKSLAKLEALTGHAESIVGRRASRAIRDIKSRQ